MQQKESSRSGYLNTSYVVPLSQVLTINVPAALSAAPIKVGQMLIVGAVDGRLRAYDVFSGALLWEKILGNPIEAAPAYAQGVVAAATKQGKLYGFDLSGNQLWVLDLSQQVVGPLLAYQGKLYTASEGGFVYALDMGTGALTGQYYVGGSVTAGLAAYGSHLVLGAPLGRVFDLSLTLALNWQKTLANGIFYRSTALFDADGIFMAPGDYDKGVYKFGGSGEILWQLADLEPSASLLKTSSLAKRQNLLLLQAGAPDTTAKLYAIDAASGALLWTHSTAGAKNYNVLPAPIFVGDKVAAIDTDGTLWVLDVNGNVLQQESLTAAGVGIVASNGLLVAALRNGKVFVYQTTPQTLPTASLTAPASGEVVGKLVRLQGTADSDYFKQYEVLVGAGSNPTSFSTLATLYQPVSGGELYTWDSSTYAEGTYVLKVVTTDIAGNQASAQAEVVLDLTPPNLTVTSPTEGEAFNSASVTVSGSTDADATVTVQGQGVSVAEDGSFTTTLTLADGAHTLTVTATDPYGNSVSKDVNITVDTTPPALSVDQPSGSPFLTNNPEVTVAGSTEAGANLTVGGSAVSLAEDGSFSTTLSLAEGTHTVDVIAKDSLGNESKVSLEITVDLTAPSLTVTEPQDGLTTNQQKLTVKGTAEQGAAVTVNGQAAALDSKGNFLHELTLSDGTHTITVVAKDEAGNTSSVSLSVTVKSSGPSLTVTTPADGLLTNEQTIPVEGSTDGTSLTVQGESVPLQADGSFATTVSLKEGANLLEIKATDAAGNVRLLQLTVTLDTTPPTLVVDSPQEGLLTNKKEVTVSGTAEVGAKVYVQGSEVTSNADGTFSTQLTLAEGVHKIEVQALDPAGNEAKIARNVTVDTTPPAITISSPSDAWQTSAAVEVKGTTEANLVVTVGEETVQSDASGSFAVVLTLAEGQHQIAVSATDPAGNQAVKEIVIKVDTTPPVISQASLNDFAGFVSEPQVTLAVSGTDGENGSGIATLWVSDTADFQGKTETFETTGSGDFVTWDLTPEDGQKRVFVRYQDVAGHFSETKELVTVLDTQSFLAEPVDPSQGGEFSTADGTKVVIPSNALAGSNGQIFLVVLNPKMDPQRAKAIPDPKDQFLEPTSGVREIFFADDQGSPLEVTFEAEVELVLPFDREELQEAEATNARIFTYTAEDWEMLAGIQEVNDKSVAARTTHFSLFRVMGVVTPGDDFVSELYNYPNPFSTTTGTIVTYRLKGDARETHLEIYTLQGDRLHTESFLVGQKGALIGRNEVRFSGQRLGRPLANGVYLYRLRGVDLKGQRFQKIGKMVVLR